MKRIGLFLLTNFFIMAMLSIVVSVLGIRPYMTAYGINYQSLMAFVGLGHGRVVYFAANVEADGEVDDGRQGD